MSDAVSPEAASKTAVLPASTVSKEAGKKLSGGQVRSSRLGRAGGRGERREAGSKLIEVEPNADGPEYTLWPYPSTSATSLSFNNLRCLSLRDCVCSDSILM